MCKKLKLQYVSTNNMIADALTKPLPKVQHRTCSEAMGLHF